MALVMVKAMAFQAQASKLVAWGGFAKQWLCKAVLDSIVLHALGFTGAVKLSACSTGLLLVFTKAGYKLTCVCAHILRACVPINMDSTKVKSHGSRSH